MFIEENELHKKNPELKKCNICEKNEEHTILLSYPFTLNYKEIIFSFLHVEKKGFICIDCFSNYEVDRIYRKY